MMAHQVNPFMSILELKKNNWQLLCCTFHEVKSKKGTPSPHKYTHPTCRENTHDRRKLFSISRRDVASYQLCYIKSLEVSLSEALQVGMNTPASD